MTLPQIESERLLLRGLEEGDAPFLLEAYCDTEAMKYRTNPPITSLDESHEMIRQAHRLFDAGKSARWAVVEKESGHVIGTFVFIFEAGQSEIGYSLRRSSWGLGYATELVWRMIRYFHEERKLENLTAKVHRENQASIRVLEKTEFVRESENATHFFFARRMNE